MRKFREWMHTTGRNKVIAVVFLIAIAIVLHYFIVERDGYIGAGKPNPTVSPKSAKEEIIGGDSIGSAGAFFVLISFFIIYLFSASASKRSYCFVTLH